MTPLLLLDIQYVSNLDSLMGTLHCHPLLLTAVERFSSKTSLLLAGSFYFTTVVCVCLLWDLPLHQYLMSPFTLLSFTHSEQSRIKRSSGWLRFGSRHHVDLQLTLQSGAVNKEWQHVGVLNLIKAKDGSIRNECSSAMLRAESHFSVYGGVCNSLSAPCVGVALCSDQITHPWTFQLSSPERQAAPFAPVELHPRSLWLIALALSNWPAFSLQGKTGRRGVSLPPAGIGGSFYTLSDKSVVWLENNHQKKKKTTCRSFCLWAE